MEFFSPQTRAQFAPSPDFLNLSMDFNASPSGTARGTEVVIPDNAPPAVRAAAERYNQQVAAFAARNGIADYPVRGVRTRSENGRGVPHTIHAEPFFNSDTAMQEAIKKNPAEFAAIYRDAFGNLPNIRAIAPHGVGRDRGAVSSIFGDETTFGEMIANAGLGQPFTLPDLAGGGSADTLAGGLSISPQGAADRLRPTIQPQGGPIQMETNTPAPATGILGSLFPGMTKERQDGIASALGSLSMHPNQSVMRGIERRQAERRDVRRETRAQQQQAQQGNQTAAWLATQPNGQRYAEAILAGVPAGQVLQMYQAEAKGQGQVKGVVVNGQLVNPITGEQIGDYRDQGGDQSAKEQQIARIKQAYGVDDRTAVGIADGVLNVSRHPVDQSVIVTNLATGESYSPQARGANGSSAPAMTGGSASQPIAAPQPTGGPDATDAFGLEGMVKGGVNSIADFAGMPPPFEGVQNSQSDFAVLRESLTNDIAAGYGRQPPSWLLQNIQDLTPQAGSTMGAGAAQSKLNALRRGFAGELANIQEQLSGRVSPTTRTELRQRGSAIQSAIGKVDRALGSFGGGTANTTKSGVQWRIEQ